MHPDFSWQNLLWVPAADLGNGWWWLVSAFATPSALIHFLYLIMNQRFSALLVARMLIFLAIVMLALTPLNSGWAPWAALTFAVATLLTGFLIATDWCNRQTPWMDGVRMVRGLLHSTIAFLAGQRRAPNSGDAVALTRDGHD